jgi:transcriptional regulator with XRE-family HTH domain
MTTTNLKDYIASRPASERRLIKAHTDSLRKEMALDELRSNRRITQTTVAKALGTSQSEVSRIEKRNDLHLSTLRGYVEGLGGKLELTAVFPEGEVIALAVAPSKKGNAMRVANKGFRGPARWKRVASSGLAAPAKRVRHSPQAASR